MRPRKDALTAAAVLLLTLLLAAPAHAAFGVTQFDATVLKSDMSTPVTQAGDHPYVGETSFTFDDTGGVGDLDVKNIRVDLPPGLISNPQAAATCTDAQFPSSCPPESQVGTEEIEAEALLSFVKTTYRAPIYNMVAGDHVSDFAFSIPVLAPRTDIIGGVRTTTDSGLFFTISNVASIPAAGIYSSKLTFWGVPSDSSHDTERGQSCTINLGIPACIGGNNPVTATHKPFLSLPTACDGAQTTTLTATPYFGAPVVKQSVTELNGQPQGATGCDKLPFDPSISIAPGTTQADEPTSATVDLKVPQSYDDASKLATAHVKDVKVVLPDGMTINPAAANGLAACADADFLKKGASGDYVANACPAASAIGTDAIKTPVLPSAGLSGKVYLGVPQPGDPYRLFVEADGFGLIVRLIGSVHPDPQTGQLTATFHDAPQLPFTDFILDFAGGPTATLATPLRCGTAATTSALTPYSGGADATPSSSFVVDADGKGGACPPPGFTLGFAAGTQDTRAGAFSPFTVDVTRADRQKLLSKLSIRQPPGLLGNLAGVPLCGEADAAAGTCPAASRIGTAGVKSGAGPQPFGLSGPVYLTGPYAGAPFGLAIAIRALAGPFDLGTVVVRAAIHVDPADSHLTIDADPLPQVLQGIPLRLREVSVAVDRPGFIFNPSGCGPLAIHGTLTATDGTVQEADAPFQATGCDSLPFGPKLTAVADGRTSAANGAGLKVTLSQPAGQANVKSVSVLLPKRLTARGTTVTGACLEATFAAGPVGCANSQVGTVHAATPLLSGPLDGPVYLVAHSTGLPTLEALMSGQGLNIDLSGTITFAAAGITSTFEHVPDVPITSFVLNLPKGPHSALSAPKGLCGGALTMPTAIVGQNGARVSASTPVSVTGCGIRFLRVRVRRQTLTVKVQVSQLGKLSLTAKGLRRATRKVAKGGSYTLRTRLSSAGRRQLARAHGRHRHLRTRITVRLGSLRARRTVTFR